jgi:hypothetical protein
MLTRYRPLPISYSFLTTPEPLPGYNSGTDIAYTPQLVDELFKNNKVLTDIHRLDVRFGKNGERVSYSSATTVDEYFQLLQAEAEKQATHLSLDQIKVLAGYLNSAHGVWLQQGITSLPFGALKGILLTHNILFGNDSKDDVYYRISVRNNKIHITHVFYAKEAFISYLSTPVNYDNRPLIKKKHEYVITETAGLYTLEYINNKSDVRIDKEFYKKDLLPAVRISLRNQKDIQLVEDNDVVFEIYSYVPFLSDPKLAKMFFAFITKPVIGTPGNYLSAAEKIQLSQKYISTCYLDYPTKKNKLLKQLYCAELKTVIDDERYDKFKREAAALLLTRVNELPVYIQKEENATLAEVVKRTTQSIRKPHDVSNINHYGIMMEKMRKVSWGKKIAAAMMVVLGLTVITVSVLTAVASFGGSSVLSAVGIAVATNIIAQSLSILCGTAGVALATGGTILGRYHPFKKLYKATFPFWNPPFYSKETGQEPSYATSYKLSDTKQEDVSINGTEGAAPGTTSADTASTPPPAFHIEPTKVDVGSENGDSYEGETNDGAEGVPNSRRPSISA